MTIDLTAQYALITEQERIEQMEGLPELGSEQAGERPPAQPRDQVPLIALAQRTPSPSPPVVMCGRRLVGFPPVPTPLPSRSPLTLVL